MQQCCGRRDGGIPGPEPSQARAFLPPSNPYSPGPPTPSLRSGLSLAPQRACSWCPSPISSAASLIGHCLHPRTLAHSAKPARKREREREVHADDDRRTRPRFHAQTTPHGRTASTTAPPAPAPWFSTGNHSPMLQYRESAMPVSPDPDLTGLLGPCRMSCLFTLYTLVLRILFPLEFWTFGPGWYRDCSSCLVY